MILILCILTFCRRKRKQFLRGSSNRHIKTTENQTFDTKVGFQFFESENKLESSKNRAQQELSNANPRLAMQSDCYSYALPHRIVHEPAMQPFYESIPCQTEGQENSIYLSPLPVLQNFDTKSGLWTKDGPSLPDGHPFLQNSAPSSTMFGPKYENVQDLGIQNTKRHGEKLMSQNSNNVQMKDVNDTAPTSQPLSLAEVPSSSHLPHTRM